MNPDKSPEVTVQILLALRKENDAVRLITERLRVKDMGPANHIRTKHEVKAWVETGGDPKEAEAIITRARGHRELQQTQNVTQKLTERQGRRPVP